MRYVGVTPAHFTYGEPSAGTSEPSTECFQDLLHSLADAPPGCTAQVTQLTTELYNAVQSGAGSVAAATEANDRLWRAIDTKCAPLPSPTLLLPPPPPPPP